MYEESENQLKDTRFSDGNLHLPTMGDNKLPGIKNWAPRSYTNSHSLEQKMCSVEENGGESGQIGAMGYDNLQYLNLSMSPGSQSSCVTGSQHIPSAMADCMGFENKKRGPEKDEQKQAVHRNPLIHLGRGPHRRYKAHVDW